MSWFEDLRRAMGNFAFGLQRIKSERIIKGLLSIRPADATRTTPPKKSNLVVKNGKFGAGFGDAEQNRLVERAAVRAVTLDYKSRGWLVNSHEDKCLGYDLCCTKGSQEDNVEVKGVRGSLVSFVITANETQAAEANPRFRLYVVTNALNSRSRKIWKFEGTALSKKFHLQPISFIAKPMK